MKPLLNVLGEQMLDIWSGTCGLASALTGHYGNLCYLERHQEAKYVLSTLSAWIEQIKKQTKALSLLEWKFWAIYFY